MVICSLCGEENDGQDMEGECPYCGSFISDEAYRCSGCGEIIDYAGDEWVCPDCQNTGMLEGDDSDYGDECPQCGAVMYGGCCEECGYPDINQGWLGEEYG